MAKILLEVRDNVLIASTEGVITSDTISVPCSISFSDEWAPYGKTIFFYQNPRKMHRVVVAGQSADFEVPPQAIITGGELHIGVFGNYTDGEGNPQRKVAVATSVPAAKGSYNGTDLPKPSVSEYEQIISIMMAYMDAREVAEIAKEATEQISTEATNAKAYITKTADEATAEISDDVAKAKNDLMEAANNATDQIAADANTVKGYVGQASAHAATAQTAAAASASARDESLAAISEALSARDEVVEVAEEALNKMGGYNAKVEKNGKRATNAEDASTVKTTDSTVAYTKTVPENALPYAEITEIGGMTRKCANLIPFPYYENITDGTTTKSGVTFTVNADGTVVANGTATAALGFALMRHAAVPVNNTYTLSCFGDNCPTGAYIQPYINGESQEACSSGTKTYNWTGNITQISIYALAGTVFQNTLIKPMLNVGSTALPYEPYFEGLRSAAVSAMESVGANLWNYGDQTFEQYKTVRLSKIMPAGSYSFGALITSDNTGDSRFLVLCVAGTNEVVGQCELELSKYDSATLVANKEFNAIRLYAGIDYNTASGHTATYTNIMFAEATTPLPYTPYFKRTLEIPEAVRALDGYGWGVSEDIYNYIDYDKKQFVKRVGAVDMGTLNWSYNTSGKTRFASSSLVEVLKPIASGVVANIVCSTYSQVGTATEVYNGTAQISTTDGSIWIHDTRYTDAATFKTAMSGVMLCYELATPEITDISDILPADNFIEVEGGGTVTMVNEYRYDVPSTVVYRVPKVGDDYVMISSPNGTVYKLTVSDSGSISAVKT